jgi:CII-binding regulator of phage lambda lysogenization HflD
MSNRHKYPYEAQKEINDLERKLVREKKLTSNLERQLAEAREDVETYKYDLETLVSIVHDCLYNMSQGERRMSYTGKYALAKHETLALKCEELERQLAEAEKALVEAHYLRFDSFLSEVEEFNYKNRNLIKALQEKHCRYLYELKEKGE